MDSKEIKELIELISRSNFSSFELEREGLKLKLVKELMAAPPTVVQAPGEQPVAVATVEAVSVPAPPAEQPSDSGLVDVHSPIVGTFYAAPSPDAPPFVEIGTRVKQGQVLCIVEAMKVMNEIEAEINAEVVEVMVANGQPVEYGELLYRLKPLTKIAAKA